MKTHFYRGSIDGNIQEYLREAKALGVMFPGFMGRTFDIIVKNWI